jgi:NADPH:quinone reductase
VRAIQIVRETGPDSALEPADLPEPSSPPSHMLTPGRGLLVEVHSAGVSFPELLQTRGQYQLKPPLPFVPGSEVAGVVRVAPEDAHVKPGERVMAFCGLGGWAELAVAPETMTFPLPEQLDYAQGAGLILNYHTAYFALVLRGRMRPGETVLVHGAAGGVGTAALQVARGLGAHTIAVVSDETKERVAREAGAEHVLRTDGPWKDEAREIAAGMGGAEARGGSPGGSGGAAPGVDIVLDPVGGERFTDSLRALREQGRVVVVGFTGGSIPEVKVNRLLLNNIEVVGAGWGGYAMARPEVSRQIDEALAPLIEGGHVRPLVGARHPLEQAAEALRELDERRATGKVVLDVRS